MRFVKWDRKRGTISCTLCGKKLMSGLFNEDDLLASGHGIAMKVVRHRKAEHRGVVTHGSKIKAAADVIGTVIEN